MLFSNKALLDTVIKESFQAIVESIDVVNDNWLAVDAQLGPGGDFREFLEGLYCKLVNVQNTEKFL